MKMKHTPLKASALLLFAVLTVYNVDYAVAYDPTRQHTMLPTIEINLDVLNTAGGNNAGANAANTNPDASPFADQVTPGKTAGKHTRVKHKKAAHKKKSAKKAQKKVDTAPEVKIVAGKDVEETQTPVLVQIPTSKKPSAEPQEKATQKPQPKPVPKQNPALDIESLPVINSPSMPSLPEKVPQAPVLPPSLPAPAPSVEVSKPKAVTPPVLPTLPAAPVAKVKPVAPVPVPPSLPLPPATPVDVTKPKAAPVPLAIPELPEVNADIAKPALVPAKPAVKEVQQLPQIPVMPPLPPKTNMNIPPVKPENAAPVPPPLPSFPAVGKKESVLPEKPVSDNGPQPDLQMVFNENETDVPLSMNSKLDVIAQQLAANADSRVSVVAYASGSEAVSIYPKRVSLARGIAVRNYLIAKKNIDVERITVKALGNKNESGPSNRVDLFIIK